MGAPAKRSKKLDRKTGTQKMWDQIAIEEQRIAQGRVVKNLPESSYYGKLGKRRLSKEEQWTRNHRCEKHNVVLARNGKCSICEMFGGPNK